MAPPGADAQPAAQDVENYTNQRTILDGDKARAETSVHLLEAAFTLIKTNPDAYLTAVPSALPTAPVAAPQNDAGTLKMDPRAPTGGTSKLVSTSAGGAPSLKIITLADVGLDPQMFRQAYDSAAALCTSRVAYNGSPVATDTTTTTPDPTMTNTPSTTNTQPDPAQPTPDNMGGGDLDMTTDMN